MLAEKKDKKKWCTDPNGTNWSKDSNKFGSRMLEKMGWSQGKGLGANEDGCTKHIKVTHKNDMRGVGCTIEAEHNWVAHHEDFSSLLAQLNNHHSEKNDSTESKLENGVSNLEKHSKSQKRVHYHKFTRGKDLSNYGENDLAAIFGKSRSRSAPVTPNNMSEAELSGTDSTSSFRPKKKKRKKVEGCDEKKKNKFTEHESTNHITSSMSVQEYFAIKMASVKQVNNKNGPDNEIVECSPDGEPIVKRSKAKKKSKTKDLPDNSLESGSVNSSDHIRLKKKRKREKDFETSNGDDKAGDPVRSKKKKSKKSKLDEVLLDGTLILEKNKKI